MSTQKDFEQITKNYRALSIQERRRTVVRSRLRYGLGRFFGKPWTLVFPLVLVAIATLAWFNRDKLPLPGGNNAPLELVMLWQFALSALIIVFSVLAFLGLLALLGTPPHAKKTDTALAHAGLVDRYGVAPALLHSQSIKGTAARKLTFCALGITKASWEEREGDICDALNVHFLEPPAYGGRKGNNRNYIVLTVAPGAGNQQTPALYDDEL